MQQMKKQLTKAGGKEWKAWAFAKRQKCYHDNFALVDKFHVHLNRLLEKGKSLTLDEFCALSKSFETLMYAEMSLINTLNDA